MKKILISVGLTLLMVGMPVILLITLLSSLASISQTAFLVAFALLMIYALYSRSKEVYQVLYQKRVVKLYTNDILFHFMRKSNRNPADRELVSLVNQLKQYTANHQKEVEEIESKLK